MNQGRPMLFLLIDDTVSVYEMFTYNNGIQGHLAVRYAFIFLFSYYLLSLDFSI